MNIADIKKGQMVRIISIDAPIVLKKRLSSLGVSVDKKVEVLEMTIQKNTIKIAVGLSAIALRLDEARCISVEVCE